MDAYNPGFEVGKNFKTIGQPAWGMSGYITPEYIARMAQARPDLFEGIEDPSALVTKNMIEGESGPQQMGWAFDPKLEQILSGMSLQRRGASGMSDGRSNALYDAQGNLVYADKPYSYDPAGDTLKSLGEAGLLAGAAFGGIGALGHGPLAGMFGGASGGAGTAAASGAGGASGAAGLEAAVAADIAASQAAAAASVGSGAAGTLTAGELAALGGAGAGGLGALQGIPALAGDFGATDLGSVLFDKAVTSGLGADAALAISKGAGYADKLLGLGNYADTAAKAGGIGSVLKKILPGGDSGGLGDLAKYVLPALAGYASYKDAKKPQLQGYTGGIQPRTATQTVSQSKYGPVVKTKFAEGGGVPRYLNTAHDGMADGIGALIDGEQQAALSGGEFVIPADVVSHIGNGNSNAGAKQLYAMMDRIRAARTGTPKQGREINPQQFMPR